MNVAIHKGRGAGAALRPFTAALLLCWVAGCGTIPAPTTFNEGFAYAEGLHTTILAGIAASLEAGRLNSTDAQAILNGADAAQAILLAAQAANAAGQGASAAGQLGTATAQLEALKTKLPAGP